MSCFARLFPLLAALPLAACQPGGDSSAVTDAEDADLPDAESTVAEAAGADLPDAGSTAAWSGIGPDETLSFTGTEPFWGGEVAGGSLTYTTPENIDGTAIAVERFAGRGGLSFSGQYQGAAFEMAVTPLECSDGMSDRTYPFTVTLQLGEEQRNGCGWTDSEPFTGPEHP